ncbi:hypothetical protein BST81_02535 [Leptolyngbya sp. 'hensonii']|uniref:hypothetical protein n=1 Tax=Leptolyngbya sp. 'hensonii' TaxID=1922337 RepID=UPI00094FC561|nr:hypothetical protein [Leptolyngbya sp. 'hensonii']OLP20023.1 hypothetical protein BST81_02535 [Leptolyngbya sp. 'hensonii']
MNHSLLLNRTTPSFDDRLRHCLALARNLSDHAEALQAFEQLRADVAQHQPEMAGMLQLLWHEVMTARRSAAFWQQLSDVEKEISEQMAANHLQLQQNYLRLMQEQ